MGCPRRGLRPLAPLTPLGSRLGPGSVPPRVTSDDADPPDRSRAVGAGIGVGIGAGWGLTMATTMGGDTGTGLAYGAAAGLVVALLAGELTYRRLTG